jgi:hypothetical protein
MMQHGDRLARDEARHVVAVANAVTAVGAAMKYNACQIARGLVVIATVMAGDDPAARTAVAKTMLDHARELDADVIGARVH